jgi:hypothetical protein|tara:strand:+ start:533 stop:901 length:369 start_codon:yes stop_codon:yes gene_type:complete
MFEFFAWKRKREVQGLNKDAQLIIEYAEQTTRPERVLEISRLTSLHLEHAIKIFGTTPIGLKRTIDEYKRLHNEARRQRDDISLSAFTLVQIYIRSKAVGKDCQPAIETIDTFMKRSEQTLD